MKTDFVFAAVDYIRHNCIALSLTNNNTHSYFSQQYTKQVQSSSFLDAKAIIKIK